MASIKSLGLMSPLTVTEYKNVFPESKSKGKYVVIAGHRRLSALKKLGYATAPCNLVEVSGVKDVILLNLTENIQRKNTTPFEEGRYFDTLMKKHDMTAQEIMVRIGVTMNYVRYVAS